MEFLLLSYQRPHMRHSRDIVTTNPAFPSFLSNEFLRCCFRRELLYLAPNLPWTRTKAVGERMNIEERKTRGTNASRCKLHIKPKTHRTSVAAPALLLPLEYIVTLGNGSGTDFQASPHHHRPALAAAADARCDYTLRRYFFKIIPSPTYDFPEQGVPTPRGRQPVILAIFSPKTTSN